jgi:hypothetical protein
MFRWYIQQLKKWHNPAEILELTDLWHEKNFDFSENEDWQNENKPLVDDLLVPLLLQNFRSGVETDVLGVIAKTHQPSHLVNRLMKLPSYLMMKVFSVHASLFIQFFFSIF